MALELLADRVSKLELLFKQLSEWVHFQLNQNQTTQNQDESSIVNSEEESEIRLHSTVDMVGNNQTVRKSIRFKKKPKRIQESLRNSTENMKNFELSADKNLGQTRKSERMIKKKAPEETENAFITIKVEIGEGNEEQEMDLIDPLILVENRNDPIQNDGSGEIDNIQDFMENFDDDPSYIPIDEVDSSDEYESLEVLAKTKKSVASKSSEHSQAPKPAKCPHCNKLFRFVRNLNAHIRMHTGEKPFKCYKCDYSSDRIRNIHRHFEKKHKSSKFQSALATQSDIKIEAQNISENSEASFECEYCKKSFLRGAGLSKHRNAMHGHEPNFKKLMFNELKSFQCSHCQKCFETTRALNDHIASHTKEKRYLCNICGKGVATNYSLRLHVRNVHGDPALRKRRPLKFVCSLCPMKFDEKRKLSEHIGRRHTGEKPFKCDKCNYATVSVTNLKTHMKQHNNQPSRDIPLLEKI